MPTTLYAIIFKESGEVLTPDSIKKYWPSYGTNGLYGWRPPKKIYYTLGKAKQGFSYIPEQLKPKLAIAEFTYFKIVEEGTELKRKQDINRIKKEYRDNIRILKAKIRNCNIEKERLTDLNISLQQYQQQLDELL